MDTDHDRQTQTGERRRSGELVPKQKQAFNPFYAALLTVGVAFTITACAYALLMLRTTRPTRSDSSESTALLDNESGLMKVLDERGMEILAVEVFALAVATVGAIALDQFRGNRQTRPERPEDAPQ